MRTKLPLVMLLLLLLCGCAPKGPPPPHLNVSIADMHVKSMGMMEQIFALQLRVQNPNNFDIETDGLSFDIETNGQTFAHGVSNKPVSVPRLSEAMVTVNAVSDISSILSQIKGVPRMAMSGFKYRLVGRFFSGQERYPFDFSGKIAADLPE
ncbi:MAG: LEA type 2 family protein [Burkholderiales bacterium]|jgi:LEA14-like dessication related protein